MIALNPATQQSLLQIRTEREQRSVLILVSLCITSQMQEKQLLSISYLYSNIINLIYLFSLKTFSNLNINFGLNLSSNNTIKNLIRSVKLRQTYKNKTVIHKSINVLILNLIRAKRL